MATLMAEKPEFEDLEIAAIENVSLDNPTSPIAMDSKIVWRQSSYHLNNNHVNLSLLNYFILLATDFLLLLFLL